MKRLKYSQLIIVPSLSGTFASPLWLTLNSKLAKKPVSPSRTNSNNANPDKTKISAKMTLMWLIMNNTQHITRYIVNWRISGLRNFCTFM